MKIYFPHQNFSLFAEQKRMLLALSQIISATVDFSRREDGLPIFTPKATWNGDHAYSSPIWYLDPSKDWCLQFNETYPSVIEVWYKPHLGDALLSKRAEMHLFGWLSHSFGARKLTFSLENTLKDSLEENCSFSLDKGTKHGLDYG